jgi:hypothetical protein
MDVVGVCSYLKKEQQKTTADVLPVDKILANAIKVPCLQILNPKVQVTLL